MHSLPNETRPPRPFVPRIDPFAPSKTGSFGELTPVSSGSGSAAASPVGSGGIRSPFLLPPRKVSVPVRRPPSPELLSQDCAFPPFPTGKTRKKEPSKSGGERTRTPEATRSKSFESDRLRSLSTGVPKPRIRQGTGESSRPSTASSSRRPSLSSRSGSRQGSVDIIPPLPALNQIPSHASSNPGIDPRTVSSDNPPSLSAYPRVAEAASIDISEEPGANSSDFSQAVTGSSHDMQTSEPSYRSKRPPPITNMPPQILAIPSHSQPSTDSSMEQHKENIPPAPSTPTTSLARSLTSLFSRKRGRSVSSKKSQKVKTPPTNGPRFMALSPDPEPVPVPRIEVPQPEPKNHSHNSLTPSNSSVNTELTTSPSLHDIHEAPRASIEIRSAEDAHPQPSEAQIAHADVDDDASVYECEADSDTVREVDAGLDHEPDKEHAKVSVGEDGQTHVIQRDTLQLEQDLEKRLAAMTAVPQLTVVEEEADSVRRASLDSASSYGSVGFSYSSTSSRSFHHFEGHSHGSSISTARTTSTNGEALAWHTAKLKSFDTVPDSPTDPYLQSGRLTPVRENALLPDSKDNEAESYFQADRLSTVEEILSSPSEEKSEHDINVDWDDTTSHAAELTNSEHSLPSPQTLAVPPKQGSELSSSDFPLRSSSRRPSTPGSFRGICRGCSQPIQTGQKSVSSKDGRLTGKYHKECFVCFTCKETFATADFYVLNDHPYCAQHYHHLNNTLCEGCGNGIEGHYLETSSVSGQGPKKFHPHCLKCATCKIQLNEDYFELGGRVYCEKDAFRVANGPRSPYGTAPSRPSPLNREYISSAEPGHGLATGRFPERRLTRLMMTA